jgi:hypothetical protein
LQQRLHLIEVGRIRPGNLDHELVQVPGGRDLHGSAVPESLGGDTPAEELLDEDGALLLRSVDAVQEEVAAAFRIW